MAKPPTSRGIGVFRFQPGAPAAVNAVGKVLSVAGVLGQATGGADFAWITCPVVSAGGPTAGTQWDLADHVLQRSAGPRLAESQGFEGGAHRIPK